jgi:fatty acid desaturase
MFRFSSIFYYSYISGIALTLLRSYAEHRPAEKQEQRSAILEAEPVFCLLYLNNNLHFLHHRDPSIPWLRLQGEYTRTRQEVLKENGGYLLNGYGEIFRKYLFKLKDSPVFPGQ